MKRKNDLYYSSFTRLCYSKEEITIFMVDPPTIHFVILQTLPPIRKSNYHLIHPRGLKGLILDRQIQARIYLSPMFLKRILEFSGNISLVVEKWGRGQAWVRKAYSKRFSIIRGIKPARRGQLSSRQGLELASMSQTLKL